VRRRGEESRKGLSCLRDLDCVGAGLGVIFLTDNPKMLSDAAVSHFLGEKVE
jgi:hypothetical protein